MAFLFKMMPYYDDILNAIIRPPRKKYQEDQLGNELTNLRTKRIQDSRIQQGLQSDRYRAPKQAKTEAEMLLVPAEAPQIQAALRDLPPRQLFLATGVSRTPGRHPNGRLHIFRV